MFIQQPPFPVLIKRRKNKVEHFGKLESEKRASGDDSRTAKRVAPSNQATRRGRNSHYGRNTLPDCVSPAIQEESSLHGMTQAKSRKIPDDGSQNVLPWLNETNFLNSIDFLFRKFSSLGHF